MSEIVGTARLGKRTKDLVKRLKPGDLAIIDHVDLDRVSAEELVESGVRAVVNVASSNSGRFPNPGPLELVRGGVRLVDAPGSDLFERLSDGETITVRAGSLWRNGTRLVEGVELTEAVLASALTDQQARVTEALEAFADNTLRHLREEGRLLTGGIDFPPLATKFRDRHAVVVARGPGYKSDLRIVRPYIRNFKPVLVAVDGGADALLEIGLRPDVIVGDFDSVTTATMRVARKLVVHAYPGGSAPGAERVQEANLEHVVYESPGVSEDVAMLLAWELGAEMIVAVGTHVSMEEFLDKGRHGMASTFLTRLLLGSVLVDAKGVSRLYASRLRKRDLALFFSVVVVLFFVLFLFLPQSRVFAESLWFIITERLRRR